MKSALIAAGLSLALHAVGLFLLLREVAPSVAPVAAREKPVEMEVMRLAGLISPAAKPVAAPELKRPGATVGFASKHPEPEVVARPQPFIPSGVEGPDDAGPANGARADDGASLDSARDERGEAAPGESSVGSASGESSPAGSAREERGAPLDTTALSRRLQQVALRCYPAAARRFRQAGEAEIRFCLDAAGALRERTIVHSSGSELLDRAANDCVVPGAAPFGPETFGRCFTVPVRFSSP